MTFQTEQNRIFAENEEGALVAEITFPETEPGVFTIDHTFVDKSLRGQGVAGRLVQAAVDTIERGGGEVQATCSYAAGWLSKRGR